MGIVSTVGSELSLFSMTILSIYRAHVVQRRDVSKNITLTDLSIVSIIVFTLIIISLIIATLPILDIFEDYYINGLHYYDIPLFIGAPNKVKHLEIIQTYYGRIRETYQQPSWETIRYLTGGMFSSDNSTIVGEKLGFYGNDGVCLFKYFVDKYDPQRIYSLSILCLNFSCFCIITICYIYVHSVASTSDSSSITTRRPSVRIRQLQRRVGAIILTDFACWVPFIVVSLLHYSNIINATEFYGFFSIVLLPINSVLNPVLYDNNIGNVFTSFYNKVRNVVSSDTADFKDDSVTRSSSIHRSIFRFSRIRNALGINSVTSHVQNTRETNL